MSKLTMHDRPFDGRLGQVCICKEGSTLRLIAIPNPDYIPEELREEGSHLIRPTAKAEYRAMSNADYKQLLIDYGVTENPPETFSTAQGGSSSANTTAGKKAASNVRVMASQANTANNQKPTPIMIYAKYCYGIEYADFTDTKFNTEAKIDLGINDESKLIPIDERKKNFELFEQNHFADELMDTRYSGEKPTINTKAYTEIKKYALSSYGSLMIRKVLTEPKIPMFKIGTESGPNSRARGNYKDNYIIIPPNFPSMEFFEISKQKILGVAIIHHEFEHTQYGNYDNPKSIKEEYLAVRYKENPVRIINGLEPRYVYYDYNTGYTINILTKEEQKGKYTYNKKDPSDEMLKVE